MAKLGDYEYPEIGIAESIELGQKIAREFAGEVSRQGLARSLGMSERGGAFSARLGALRLWGVAGGRSRVRVTRDGLRAVTPLSARESEDARASLARNVSLFVEMSARLGEGPCAPDRLAVLLEELSGADRTEVARRLTLIDRIFSEARPYLPKPTVMQAQQYQAVRSATADRPVIQTGTPPGHGFEGPGAPPAVSEESSPGYGRPVTGHAADRGGERARPGVSGAPGFSGGQDMGDRIELGLPDGTLSLPETLANLDAALTVLWARRQLVAAVDAAEGRATPAPPRDFTRASGTRT